MGYIFSALSALVGSAVATGLLVVVVLAGIDLVPQGGRGWLASDAASVPLSSTAGVVLPADVPAEAPASLATAVARLSSTTPSVVLGEAVTSAGEAVSDEAATSAAQTLASDQSSDDSSASAAPPEADGDIGASSLPDEAPGD
jgi:hypothetical protein